MLSFFFHIAVVKTRLQFNNGPTFLLEACRAGSRGGPVRTGRAGETDMSPCLTWGQKLHVAGPKNSIKHEATLHKAPWSPFRVLTSPTSGFSLTYSPTFIQFKSCGKDFVSVVLLLWHFTVVLFVFINEPVCGNWSLHFKVEENQTWCDQNLCDPNALLCTFKLKCNVCVLLSCSWFIYHCFCVGFIIIMLLFVKLYRYYMNHY